MILPFPFMDHSPCSHYTKVRRESRVFTLSIDLFLKHFQRRDHFLLKQLLEEQLTIIWLKGPIFIMFWNCSYISRSVNTPELRKVTAGFWSRPLKFQKTPQKYIKNVLKCNYQHQWLETKVAVSQRCVLFHSYRKIFYRKIGLRRARDPFNATVKK